jgi:ClpP class serine protease
MDPFVTPKQEDIDTLKDLQGKIHEDFKDWVKLRRNGKLKSADPKKSMESTLMGGRYWTSKDSLKYGLIDGVGEMEATLRQKFGESVNIDYGKTEKPGLMQIISSLSGARAGGVESIGAEAVDRLLHRVEERSLWKRFGL